MIKRNFSDTINARKCWAQCREMMLLVLTHNIAVILIVKELFYRACQEPFSPYSLLISNLCPGKDPTD